MLHNLLPNLLLGCALAAGPQSLSERIDVYVQNEMSVRGVPATAVAVVRSGEIVHAKAYGTADVELSVPADTRTVFELLSVSKQFTAAAVLLLERDGKLALEDELARHVDGLPTSWRKITILQLLSHTSGIPDYTDQPGWMETLRQARTPEELLAPVKARPLVFVPGTQWGYSNSNYYLLGLLIEKSSAVRFDAFLEQRVFAPLDMRATRLESFEQLIPHRASGYHATSGGIVNAPWIDPSHKWAAGAFLSSIDDMAKWTRALDSDVLLPARVRERMVTGVRLSDGTSASYGLGNELALDHGHRVAGHQGGGMAFNATLLHFPDDRLSVVVLCNLTQAPSKAWARNIAAFWLPDIREEGAAIADPDPRASTALRKVLVDAAQGKADPECFAPDMRDELTAFVRRVGPQFLGPLGALERLTPLGAAPDAQGGLRYRARFAKGSIVWDLEVDGDGRIRKLEPTLE